MYFTYTILILLTVVVFLFLVHFLVPRICFECNFNIFKGFRRLFMRIKGRFAHKSDRPKEQAGGSDEGIISSIISFLAGLNPFQKRERVAVRRIGVGRGILNYYSVKQGKEASSQLEGRSILLGKNFTGDSREFIRLAGGSERAVLYQPSAEFLPYISQFLLISSGGAKGLKCRLTKLVSHINYDVILYDSEDRAFEALNVSEKLSGCPYTATISLPSKTAYIGLVVNSAGSKEVRKKQRQKNQLVRLVFAALFAFFLSVSAVFLLKHIIANMLADVFGTLFLTSDQEIAIILAVILGVTNALLQIVHLWSRRSGQGGQV